MPTVANGPIELSISLNGGDPLPCLDATMNAAPVTYLRSLGAVMPDPKWRKTDSHGHAHRWVGVVEGESWDRPETLPTLVKSYVPQSCNGACGDEWCEGYSEPVWHCRDCGDEVSPRFVPDHVARTTGRPLVTGSPSASLVVGHDPDGTLRNSREAFDAVLRGTDGFEKRGKAYVGGWSAYSRGAGPDELRIEIEMAILDR